MVSSGRLRLSRLALAVAAALFAFAGFNVFSSSIDGSSSSGGLGPISVDPDFLYYIRVPKSGSINMAFVLRLLGERNGFRHYSFHHPGPRRIDDSRQAAHAKKLDRKRRPFSYDRHVYFFDFNRLGRDSPVWFSLVREPTAQIDSRHYYMRGLKYRKLVRANASSVQGVTSEQYQRMTLAGEIFGGRYKRIPGQCYDLTVSYFCGQSLECCVLGSRWALEEAERNVERWFPVVGVLELLPETLEVAEAKMPRFFKGAVEMYWGRLKRIRKNRGKKYPKLPPRARDMLARNLTLETEFYNYVKRRLRKQLGEIRRQKQKVEQEAKEKSET